VIAREQAFTDWAASLESRPGPRRRRLPEAGEHTGEEYQNAAQDFVNAYEGDTSRSSG